MHKWANRIFTGVAILGWVLFGVLTLDAMFNQAKLITGIMAGQ